MAHKTERTTGRAERGKAKSERSQGLVKRGVPAVQVFRGVKTSDTISEVSARIFKHYHQFYKSTSVKMTTIRRGLEATAITDFIHLTGVTRVDLAQTLSLTEPTLRKYIKEGKGLNQGITEHMIQLFELFEKGMDTFGSLEEFKNWLPHHNIGINARPIDLLDTITGINIVMNELLRIDYGVLA